jgi:two-component system response regulator FixJ
MGSKGTVYVVDDEAPLRRMIVQSLREAGFDPRPFVSGVDFLDALHDLAPGCVLLDVHMPIIDGLTVQEDLNKRRPELPVLFMSGAGTIPMAVRAIKMGAFDFLEKPFTLRKLIEQLDRAFLHLEQQMLFIRRHREAVTSIGRLTGRELDVIHGLLDGLPNKLVAQRLGLSPRTVEMHRANIFKKLGVHSLPEVAQISLEAGLKPGDMGQDMDREVRGRMPDLPPD